MIEFKRVKFAFIHYFFIQVQTVCFEDNKILIKLLLSDKTHFAYFIDFTNRKPEQAFF